VESHATGPAFFVSDFPRRQLDWNEVDPFLRGPYRSPASNLNSFEVPAHPTAGWQYGRIRSAERWPHDLATVDRVVALPTVSHPQEPIQGKAILTAECEPGQRIVLCQTTRSGGSIRWNLDPVGWIRGLLGEEYVAGWRRPLPSRLPWVNYSWAPHFVKGLLQGSPGQVDSRPLDFPVVPFDDLVEVLRELCWSLASGGLPERQQLWPRGSRAALTLAHDVDTSWILRRRNRVWLHRILDAEAALGFRGAWYVTGDQLHPSRQQQALQAIAAAGHEIGSHGWNHDAKLPYLPAARQRARMRKVNQRMQGMQTEGIRTPWYCRSKKLMTVLADYFQYSCSVPNSSAFFSSNSNSGCCSVFPFRRSSPLFELPMTLPPDSFPNPAEGFPTLHEISRRIIERQGVIVVTLHPQPHQSANDRVLPHYLEFLRQLKQEHGESLWSATPKAIVSRYRERVEALGVAQRA
jgi:peptidoglycan/xylan/chitin deacetylase (PgdA/CDA1 family)